MALSLGLKPHGYHVEFDVNSSKGAVENDTYTCQHCGCLTLVKTRDQPQAWCKRCMGMVCENCAPKGACNNSDNPNLQTWLEQQEAKNAEIKLEIERQLERAAAHASYSRNG